jgi:hypothetical protein
VLAVLAEVVAPISIAARDQSKGKVVTSTAGLIRRRIGASWKPLVLDAAPSSS